MKRIVLVAFVAGMSFVIHAGVVQGGGPYDERSARQGRQLTVRTDLYPEAVPYHAARPCGERYNRTLYPRTYTYERRRVPIYAEVPDYEVKPREKKIFRVPCSKETAPARMIQKTTVIIDCQKPASVKPVFKPKKINPMYADPCPKELQGVKDELLATRNKLVASQERERVSSVERQKLAEANATLRERARNREIWIEDYRTKYIEHNGWR